MIHSAFFGAYLCRIKHLPLFVVNTNTLWLPVTIKMLFVDLRGKGTLAVITLDQFDIYYRCFIVNIFPSFFSWRVRSLLVHAGFVVTRMTIFQLMNWLSGRRIHCNIILLVGLSLNAHCGVVVLIELFKRAGHFF